MKKVKTTKRRTTKKTAPADKSVERLINDLAWTFRQEFNGIFERLDRIEKRLGDMPYVTIPLMTPDFPPPTPISPYVGIFHPKGTGLRDDPGYTICDTTHVNEERISIAQNIPASGEATGFDRTRIE